MSRRIYYTLDGTPSFFDDDFSTVFHRLDAIYAQYWLFCADADGFDNDGSFSFGGNMEEFKQAADAFIDYGVATHPEVNTEVFTEDGIHWTLGGWPDVLEDFLSYMEDAGFAMICDNDAFESAVAEY